MWLSISERDAFIFMIKEIEPRKLLALASDAESQGALSLACAATYTAEICTPELALQAAKTSSDKIKSLATLSVTSLLIDSESLITVLDLRYLLKNAGRFTYIHRDDFANHVASRFQEISSDKYAVYYIATLPAVEAARNYVNFMNSHEYFKSDTLPGRQFNHAHSLENFVRINLEIAHRRNIALIPKLLDVANESLSAREPKNLSEVIR